MIQWNQTNLFEMFALNPEAPSFVPAHLQAPQVCEYNDVEYEETKEDDGNDSVEYENDDEDCYVESDGKLVPIDDVGEWFRIEGGGYYHVFEGVLDDNNGHFYTQPFRRSLTWWNSR
jgi:hypothetical protein